MKTIRTLITMLSLVAACWVGGESLAVGPPPIPVACLDDLTCDCLCSNGYSPYLTWSVYGCWCGNPTWSPTCVRCVHVGDPVDGYDQCETVDYAQGSSCQFQQGMCYEYSWCNYTGP